MKKKYCLLLLCAIGVAFCHRVSSSKETSRSDSGLYNGEYDQGVYHCCAKGDGTDCCEGYKQGMCFQYGGIYKDCIPEGENIGRKVICSLCCKGFSPHEIQIVTEDKTTYEGYAEGCGSSGAPPDIQVCVACGNGVCGPGENLCICPEDCTDRPSLDGGEP
jgi:hypothetical protein